MKLRPSLILLLLAMSMPLCAQTQTTLNNNGCSCTSYQGAYLPVTNGGNVAYVHMNPFAAPFFETPDANFNVLQEWTDFVVSSAQRVSTISKRNLQRRKRLHASGIYAKVLPERVHIGFCWRSVSFANPIESPHFRKKSSTHADSGAGSTC
jgi:hypothetical protein